MVKINNEEKLLIFIKKCMRNHYKPDLHSFCITTERGSAFVDCVQKRVRIDYCSSNGRIHATNTFDSAEEAAHTLQKLGARFETIDM